MKKTKSMLGILALLVVFAFTACDNGTTGNDDFHFANTSWISQGTTINFINTTEWEGQANPDLGGTFRVEGNVAHLTVTHLNGDQLDIPGSGRVTVTERPGGIIIVVIVITIGGENIVDEEEAVPLPDGFESVPHFIQGIWTNGINSAFPITGNQVAVFDNVNNEARAVFVTSHNIINELVGIDVNVELGNLGIVSPDRIYLFRMTFFEFENFHPVGRVYGFWVDFDGTPLNEYFVITARYLEPHALSSYIPNIDVYHRGWL